MAPSSKKVNKSDKTDLSDATSRHGAPASLATLSAHLGLSVAAISRVLNGVPAAKSIPKTTQDRIFAAAKEFNYRPNALARSLRHGRSMMVGVLVPEVSEGYATLVLAGIEQGLLQSGYIYFLISHHHRSELIERAQSLLMERSVDGIIAIDTIMPLHSRLPTITVSCPDEQEGVTNIMLNQRRAVELALDHLVGLGHREIAIIKGQSFSSDTEPRWQAIRHAASRAQIKLNPKLVAQLEGDAPSHEPGYFAAQRLLASDTPFTALFTFNDVSAIGAIRALREAGLRVPQDVSVVGFDDVQSAAFQNPSLTTVRQPLRTMGMLAAEALVRQITAHPDHPPSKQLVVDPELVVRESTCPPPAKKRAKS
ncbi:LacI family DNA-binding transcriptional regulator [Granulicella mallensis]|uniref:LacI family transcriptional regulator n=1 Tax=Granulicella mallensis TaxID=940614 RepID=A0A7W7ZPP7_9BACT|nr:LacI family DNA-binding transcriptional regulator [Granulicella mallensis]MBB5063855.1 LacI family transcriptional regulator [Granulicella mallensis]